MINNKNIILTDSNLAHQEIKQLSKTKRICLYLFLGGLIGDVLVVTTMVVLNLSSNDFFVVNTYVTLCVMLIVGYPIALIIGGIPAVLTALLIDATKTNRYEYIHAFAVGFTVCLLCYVIPMGAVAFLLSIAGGLSASITLYFIKRLEQ